MSPSQNQVPSKELLISGHQLHPPPQVQAHAHDSSKPSVTGVFSVFSATTKHNGFTLATDDLLRRPPYLATRL